MKISLVVLALTTGALIGCAAESKAPPVSSASSGGSSSQMPQSSNALPRGSAVNAPLDSATGTVGTSRVGPSRTSY